MTEDERKILEDVEALKRRKLRAETVLDRQLLVHNDRLEGGTPRGVLVHHLAALLVLLDCAGFRHCKSFLVLACRYCRNGKLKAFRRALASSSVLAVVQTMMSIPQIWSTLS